MNILIVDDEKSHRHILGRYLLRQGPDFAIYEAASKLQAFALLEQNQIDVAFVDLDLGGETSNRDGQQIVKHIRENTSAVAVVISGHQELVEVTTAMKNGALDFLPRHECSQSAVTAILDRLGRGIEGRELKQQVRMLRDRNSLEAETQFIGASAAAERIRGLVRRFAFAEQAVLVTGPTGTGKEVVARLLHSYSMHPEAPMISLNCGALPASLIESQLFGHRKGAFTGANEDRQGFFQAVGEGTLFLDEIAELPLELQPQLLRVLENRTFMPIGGNAEVEFKGRIVAATHADLHARVAERKFREDLLFRLNVLRIDLPPLKERKEDIPLFAALFLGRQKRKMSLMEDAVRELSSFDWPGNVRQLRNTIDLLAILYDEPSITAEMIREVLGIGAGSESAESATLESAIRSFVASEFDGDKLAFLENAAIAAALEMAEGNKSAAAKMLGVHRKVVQRRVEGELCWNNIPLDSLYL